MPFVKHQSFNLYWWWWWAEEIEVILHLFCQQGRRMRRKDAAVCILSHPALLWFPIGQCCCQQMNNWQPLEMMNQRERLCCRWSNQVPRRLLSLAPLSAVCEFWSVIICSLLAQLLLFCSPYHCLISWSRRVLPLLNLWSQTSHEPVVATILLVIMMVQGLITGTTNWSYDAVGC